MEREDLSQVLATLICIFNMKKGQQGGECCVCVGTMFECMLGGGGAFVSD